MVAPLQVMREGSAVAIRRLRQPTPAEIDALVDVLIDCVEGGASVSFMWPMTVAKARRFWDTVAEGVVRGARALLVAEDEHGIVGTVQLVLDQPENQPHRADVSKMLVHRRGRRRGIGAALLAAVDQVAREEGRDVLVLDTVSGSDAERLYARHGWERCGVIPDYALLPGGGLVSTTYFYRRVPASAPSAAAAGAAG
jgi:GNAT superfamily N-acetyltransferase